MRVHEQRYNKGGNSRDEQKNKEYRPYNCNINVEIGSQSRTYSSDYLVVRIAVNSLRRSTRIRSSRSIGPGGLTGLVVDIVRSSKNCYYIFYNRQSNHSVFTGLFRKQFGHSFLDTIDYFISVLLCPVVVIQLFQITLKNQITILFNCEGNVTNTYFNNLFHIYSLLFLIKSIVCTSSFQALSISARSSLPLSVIE